MTHWWRAYDDSIDHPKLLKLSDAMHRAWWTLMCVASANGGTLPPTADIAVRLRMKPAKVAEWITKLVQANLIDNQDGVFRPHNWDDRQFVSDSSTERVKRHRERKRNVPSSVTGNVSVTLHETATEQSRAETDSEQSRAEARALDEIGLKNEAVLTASFTALCSSLNRTPPDMRQIATWLLDGVQLGTIQAAVTPILKRKSDMASLAYCDSAVREAHGRAAAPALQIVPAKGVWVDEGTPEWACWQREYRGGRGSPVTDHQDVDGRRSGRRGWYFESKVPAGYDDVTCEKLPPSEEDAA